MSRASAQVPVASIEYEELEIEVGRCLCGKGEVRILGSRFNRPRERFRPSYDIEELNRRLEELDKLLLEGPEVVRQRRQLAESIGQDLFSALLPDKVRQTFRMSLASLRTLRAAERNVGLRLRLSFGEASRYLPDVVGLPWELLCSPDTREFLTRAPETPLVRFLDLERPVEAVTVTPPIRVLAVLASPRELREIDREQHEKILRGACQPGRLELKLLEPPTLATLLDRLHHHRASGKPIHVVHFLGHGAFDDSGEGFLNFEQPDRSADRVLGRDLAQILGGFQEVRLAVLSTCVGARMMRRQGQHPFTGSASALVAGGLPAVVGMQFPVSEAAAAAFTHSFYGHLADGRTLEEAVTEGRLRILATNASNFEWASPVLFLRSRDGKVFDLAGPGLSHRQGLSESNLAIAEARTVGGKIKVSALESEACNEQPSRRGENVAVGMFETVDPTGEVRVVAKHVIPKSQGG
jgi:CHAT domain-containing protein